MSISQPLSTKHWPLLLATLFVIVLIAHLAIISSARGNFGTLNAISTDTFTTRVIELPPPTLAIEKQPEPAVPKIQTAKLAKPAKTKSAADPVTATDASQAPIAAPVPPPTPLPAPAQPETRIESEAMPVASDPTSTPPAASATGESGQPAPAFVALNAGLHTYKVLFTKNGISNQGNALIRWQQDGEKYALNLLAKYTFLVRTFNILEQNSLGTLAPQGLQPVRFSDKRLTRSEVAAHFDYSSGKITFSANKPDIDLQAGAQDRLSVIWQLAGVLAAQPLRYLPGSTLTIQTVSAADAEPWLFTVNEPETLNLSTGSHIALRLTRNPRREFDQKVELWFATDLNYLPVRFRFTDTNNDYIDAVWQSTQNLPNSKL